MDMIVKAEETKELNGEKLVRVTSSEPAKEEAAKKPKKPSYKTAEEAALAGAPQDVIDKLIEKEAKAKAKKAKAEGSDSEIVHTGDVLSPAEAAKSEISDAEAAMVREQVKTAFNTVEEGYFQLSELLQRVKNGFLYTRWGFSTFEEFVTKELGFQQRKAQYLIQIGQWATRKITSEDSRKELHSLGWSKAKELVEVADDSNIGKWVERAKTLTVAELQEEVKAEKHRVATAEKTGDDRSLPSNESEASAPKKEVFEKMNFSLSPDQAHNVNKALQQAGTVSESDKKGHLLDLICTAFLANGSGTMEEVLAGVERSLGVKLVAVSVADNTIKYGDSTIDWILKTVAAADGENPSS